VRLRRSRRLTLRRHADVTTSGGRELFRVNAIATAWEVDMYPDGKTVWFTISRGERC